MIKTIIFDFSRVLLFPKNSLYTKGINDLHNQLKSHKEYNLFEYFYLNTDLLEKVSTYKDRYKLYIFTTGIIQNEKQLKKQLLKIFQDIYTVEDIGLPKHDHQAYLKLAEKVSTKPEEIFFIDDTLENIEAAKKAGLYTLHFQSNPEAITYLESLKNKK